MADEPGVEHGVQIGRPVRTLLRQAPKPRPFGDRNPSVDADPGTLGVGMGRFSHVAAGRPAPGRHPRGWKGQRP